jgi:DNA helicase HerA-like ATPase
LNNAVYRRKIVATLSDQRLKSFWFNEYEKAGDMQRVKLSFGVTSKLGRLLNSSVVRRSLAQPHSTIDFNEILNQNKILICNLSKGKIGEDNTDLIGSLILAKIQQAAYARQLLPTKMRKSFYVYVDEFQNFATKSFLQMLSESRKFGLALTIAEQTLSQQNEIGFNDTLLANVGSLICFRTSSPNDEKVLLPLFNNIEPSELLNLPSHHFIMRINAVDSFVPFSGQTVLAEPSKIDLSNEVISLSQKKYAYQG